MILVSACLLGYNYRYKGGNNRLSELITLLERQEVRPVCPEVDGGLSTPRPPAEIIGGEGRDVLAGKAVVKTIDGQDVTGNYLRGSRVMLTGIDPAEVEFAILKARSPACGNRQIYNGEFNGSLKDGSGVGAAFLEGKGIRVFSEEELEKIKKYLNK